jgi:hydroxymethylglutaryl-CoA synthase
MAAITAVGAYAPRFRIDSQAFEEAWGQFQAAGVTEKAVPAADEDTLTTGLEAADRAMQAAGISDEISWFGFATTNPPLEEDGTARLGAMLSLSKTTTHQMFTGSTRAATRALWAGLDAVEVGSGPALVVVADAPRGEPEDPIDHAAGAGAAGFIIQDDGPAEVVDQSEYTVPYLGTRFRQEGKRFTSGLGITQYDRQAFTETISGAVDGLEADTEPEAAAIQAPDGRLPYRTAGVAGISSGEIRSIATVHDLGDLGAASVPVTLARGLAEGFDSVLAVSHGSGAGADVFLVNSPGTVSHSIALDDGDSLSYDEYLRQRGVVTSEPPSGGGAYVSVPSWRRSIPHRYRLLAGRCVECDALAFPPEGACNDCGTLSDYEPVKLSRKGTIESLTTISQGEHRRNLSSSRPRRVITRQRLSDYLPTTTQTD